MKSAVLKMELGNMIKNITVLGDHRRLLSKERTFVLRCKCRKGAKPCKDQRNNSSQKNRRIRQKSRCELGVLEKQKEGSVLEHSGVREPGSTLGRGL